VVGDQEPVDSQEIIAVNQIEQNHVLENHQAVHQRNQMRVHLINEVRQAKNPKVQVRHLAMYPELAILLHLKNLQKRIHLNQCHEVAEVSIEELMTLKNGMILEWVVKKK
jgi:hypothetical protein